MGIENVPKDMTAVQVVEFNKPYKIHKVPTPQELGPNDVLIKTAVASLCHTDSMVREGKFPTKLPCTGSHEGTGVVVAVGSKVENFKKGDRIMSGIPKNACNECQSCKKGDDYKQYCANVSGMIGVMNHDGAFAEYHLADSSTIYRAIITSGAKKGSWLGIVGAGGGLGHLGIQFAKSKGINVIAIDARDLGIELSKKAGAEHVIDAREGQEEVVKKVQALTDGLGVEAVINVSEHESSAPLSCAITRMHGLVVQVAQPPMVSVPFRELIFRDITIKGTLVAGQKIAQEMLNEAGRSGVKVETAQFKGLDKVPDMVELAHSGKLKGKAVCVVDDSV